MRNRGLILKTGHRRVLTRQRVMPRQRLDTKQEPKYTETNKTQVDTMKLTRTEQDTGEDNETGNTRAGKETEGGGHGCGHDH